MKKILKLIAIILCFSVFTACSFNQFMDLSGFVYAFNKAGDEDIDLEDVSYYTDGKQVIYESFFEDDTIVLKLVAENDKIKMLRVAFSKKDKNGTEIPVSNETIADFNEIVKSSIVAYCAFDKANAETIMNELGLYEKNNYTKSGENTKTKENFHIVFFSDSLVCKLMIYNTYLEDVPKTEKPVSKPAFGNTTNVIN